MDDTRVNLEFNDARGWSIKIHCRDYEGNRCSTTVYPDKAFDLAIDILTKAREAKNRQANEPKKDDP